MSVSCMAHGLPQSKSTHIIANIPSDKIKISLTAKPKTLRGEYKMSDLLGQKKAEYSHHIETRWILSYITVVFCCVVLIGTVLIILGQNFAYREAQEKLLAVSQKTSNALEQKMDYIKQSAIKLSMTDWISHAGNPSLSNAAYDSNVTISDSALITLEINNYCNVERAISNITVFFPNTNMAYDKKGDFTLDEYFHFPNNYAQSDYQAFLKVFESNNYFHFTTITRKDTISSLLIYNCFSQGAFIVVELNPQELVKSSLLNNVDTGYEALLMRERTTGHMILGNATDFADAISALPSESSISFQKLSLGNTQYTSVIIPSSATPYDYYFIYPENYRTENARIIQRFVVIAVIVALVLGIALSVVFVSINYKPLKKLITQIQSIDNQQNQADNEYEYIENTLSSWRVEVQKAQETSARYQKAAWHHLLIGVLTGTLTVSEEKIFLMSDNTNGCDSNCYYCAVIIGFVNQGDVFDGTIHPGFTEPNEELANCAGRSVAAIKSFKLWQHLAISSSKYVIIFRCDTSPEPSEVKKLFQHLRAELDSIFSSDLCLAVGEFRKGLEGISASFQIAEKLYIWQTFTGNVSNDALEKFNHSSSRYYLYPHDWENKLISESMKGNWQEVSAVLDDLFKENCEDRNLSIQMKKRLINRLLETAYVTLSKMEKEDLSLFTNIEQKLDEMNEAECWSNIQKLFSAICEIGLNNQIKIGQNKIFQKIVDYVSQNFTDYNISLKDISAKFAVQEYAVSKMFKTITGYNFLDFVNRRRINLAKQMLCTTNEPIYTISEKIGFDNDRSFRRVFKKYEGIGPLEYRNMKREKEEADGEESSS